jgi:hypothetical protein
VYSVHPISLSIVPGIPITGMPATDKLAAPLKEPSPPIITTASIPKILHIFTDFSKPSLVINSADLAVCNIVPPLYIISETDLKVISSISPLINP